MQLCFEKPDQNILVLTSSITCDMFQGTELMMDKDFPESLLDSEVAQESQQGRDLDRRLQDHEDQNPDGQNPTQVRGERSDLHQNQMEVLGRNKDPGLASGQEADCPDRNQPDLDLDHGEENHVGGGWSSLFKHLLINFFFLIYE